jgi:hypothetical protein
MNVKTDEETLLTRYLLGELPEAEQLLVEERFFADDAYFEQLLALENELKYDYTRGGLTPSQRARFAERFLKTPQERRAAALAGAILDTAAEVNVAHSRPAAACEEQASWRRRLLAFFALQNQALQFSLAALALALLLGGAWLLFDSARLRGELAQLRAAAEKEQQAAQQQAVAQSAQQKQLQNELADERQRRNQLERELAQEKNEQAEAAQKQPSFLAFALSSGLVRGEAETKRLVVPADVNALRLRLNLKKKGAFVRYRGALQTLDGAELWSQDIRRSQAGGQVQAVTWYLPARLFTAGDYVILLKGITAQGESVEVGDYYFTVVRK